MGKLPKLKAVKNTKKKEKKAYRPEYKVGDTVYFTAYLKKEREKFYVCKGVIQGTPDETHHLYKVKIVGISDRAVGSDPVVKQASLLGVTISKKGREMSRNLSPILTPQAWINYEPEDEQDISGS